MLRSTKPNRCKHCRERMPAELARHVLHDACIDPWLAARAAKKAREEEAKRRAAAKVERAATVARRRDLKSLAELAAEAQTAFNAFIRHRDRDQTCICCGKPFEPQKPGGSMDAGHWRSRGAAPQLRFDEANVHGQRKNCNRPGGAKAGAFYAGMVARVGLAEVERLEADDEIRKWTRQELIDLRALYIKKLKDLKASAP